MPGIQIRPCCVEEAQPFHDDSMPSYDSVEDQSTPSISAPEPRSTITPRTKVAIILLAFAAGLERVTFYSFQTNLSPFINKYIDNSTHLIYFFATAEFLPLVGAWLGESVIGEYKSSVLGLVLETAASCILLPWTAYASKHPPKDPQFDTGTRTEFVLAMVLMTAGLSFTRTNLMVLTAKYLPENRLRDVSFFLWFYWFINLGGLLGCTMAGVYDYVTIIVMWPLPLIIALLLVYIANKVDTDIQDRPSIRASEIIWESLTRSFCRPRSISLYESVTSEIEGMRMRHEHALLVLAKHMKTIFMILAIHIIFEALYAVQDSWLIEVQTDWKKTERELGYDFRWIPQLYDEISVILVIPLTHFAIKPLLRRYWPAALNQLRLMGVGMVLGAASCFAAAIVQFTRRHHMDTPFKDAFTIAIPHHVLLGLSEIFTYVVGYEFIYMETPAGFRNTMLGLYFSSMGLGLYLQYAFTWLLIHFHGFEPKHPHRGNLGYFLVALAVIQIVVLIPYILLARGYRYKRDYGEDIDEPFTDRRRPRFGSSLMESDSFTNSYP